MTEQEIKEILQSYVNQEMETVREDEMPGYEHVYSKKYEEKKNRLFFDERKFGKKFYFEHMVRRVAMIAVIILSLFMVNEVSAKTLNFNPWKYIISYISSCRMDVKKYVGLTNDKTKKEITVKRNIPKQIPEDMKRTSFYSDNESVYVEWKNGDKYLQYSRENLADDIYMAGDSEYQNKEKIDICGMSGYYYIKEKEEWIVWNDKQYNYMIMATDFSDAKNVLLKMAESIYK